MAEAEKPTWYARRLVGDIVESPRAQRFIIIVILINAAALGLETSPRIMERWSDPLHVIDQVCLTIFVIEIISKLYAHGWRFFTNAWNVFDFIIVGIALVPGGGAFAVLRAMRVLRVLRLISTVPSLRRVVDGLMRAIPGIASIAALLFIVFYVGAVMSTMLFREHFPDEYGTFGRSMFSLFQVMTLDNWSTMVRDIWGTIPWAPAFFIPFILLSAMTVLNLLVAVIIDAMHGLGQPSGEVPALPADDAATPTTSDSDVAAELAKLRAEVAELSALLRGRTATSD